jgi:hypothetical protein
MTAVTKNTYQSDDIQNLKARLVVIQNEFITTLTGADDYTEEDLASLGEMLSWATSSETILTNLRVEILLKVVPTADAEIECVAAMDTISTIHKQIIETEAKLRENKDERND